MSKAARSALDPVLGAGEGVGRVAPAVGCTLILTDRRLFVVREGASYRPKSGIVSCPLDRQLTIRVGPARRDSSPLVVERAGRSASVFLTGADLGDARMLVADIRQRVHADG